MLRGTVERDVKTMSKKQKNKKISGSKHETENKQNELESKDSEYLCKMSYAPKIDESVGVLQLAPLLFFTAFIIMIVRMTIYTRPMEQFYWTTLRDDTQLIEFFSYWKMVAILVCGALILLLFLYRAFTQSLAIKKTFVYIPMLVYTAWVVLSYIFSDYKAFALLGYNERFEGTLVLIAYMVMLFYAINTINTEKNVRWMVRAVAISSVFLGLLGVSQAIGRDFFRTQLGGMLITPSRFWEQLSELEFTFQSGEIYQTVYNINYVSFYLTLIIPIFGFILVHSIMQGKSEKLRNKIIWGMILALALFNLVGSASIGGALGLGVTTIMAFALLGKKLVTEWRKPLMILLAIALPIIIGFGHQQWLPKIFDTITSTVAAPAAVSEAEVPIEDVPAVAHRSRIDYMEVLSEEHVIHFSIEGNELTFTLHPDAWPSFDMSDADGNPVHLAVPQIPEALFPVDDERFGMISVAATQDHIGRPAFIIITDGVQAWRTILTREGLYFMNDLGNLTPMRRVPAIGFENNQDFGSGRGYIWSRTLPMMRDTFLIGHGADTYVIFFPHYDYVGKFNAGWNINQVVDKPHNMYMHMAIGTGGISMLAFLILLGFYVVQSIKIYRKREYNEFIEFVGFGIFLGIVGFAFAGLVNDSSVSVMPMFYGLLGTGIAVNMMLKQRA